MGAITVNAHMYQWEISHKEQMEEEVGKAMLLFKKVQIEAKIGLKTQDAIRHEIADDWREEKEERRAKQADERKEAAKMRKELREQCAVRKLAGGASHHSAGITKSRRSKTCKGLAVKVKIPPRIQAPTKEPETKFLVTINKPWSQEMEEQEESTTSQALERDEERYPKPSSPKVKSTVTIPIWRQEQLNKEASSRNKKRYDSREPSHRQHQPISFKAKQHINEEKKAEGNKGKKLSQEDDRSRRQNEAEKSKKRGREPSQQKARPAGTYPSPKRSTVKAKEQAREKVMAPEEMSESPATTQSNEYSPLDASTFKDKKKGAAQLGKISLAELNKYVPSRKDSSSSGYTHSDPEPMDVQQFGDETENGEDDYEDMGFG
ncbi:unnamed protein product [Caenorhabditis nigoni]